MEPSVATTEHPPLSRPRSGTVDRGRWALNQPGDVRSFSVPSGNALPLTIRNFWAWSCSDLMTNALRRVLAELQPGSRCSLQHTDQATVDPTNLDQRSFVLIARGVHDNLATQKACGPSALNQLSHEDAACGELPRAFEKIRATLWTHGRTLAGSLATIPTLGTRAQLCSRPG